MSFGSLHILRVNSDSKVSTTDSISVVPKKKKKTDIYNFHFKSVTLKK